MISKSHIALLILTISTNYYQVASNTATLTVHRAGAEPYSVSGSECPYGLLSYSDEPLKCACMTGLWAFYEDTCGPPSIIAGGPEEKCISLDRKIEKVHLLANDWSESVVAFSDDMKSVETRLTFGSELPNGRQTLLIPNGIQWGIPSRSVCFKSEASVSSTCRYRYNVDEDMRISSTCNQEDKIIEPSECDPEIESVACSSPKRHSFMQGRVMSRMIKALNLTENTPVVDDPATAAGMDLDPDLASMIFNYLTEEAQTMLNITTKSEKSDPPSLTFKLLDLTKQIMQKACPESYVNKAHFDLALGTFTALQTKIFKFKDEFTDKVTADRIEDALLNCLYSIEPYPFVDPLNRTVYPNNTCDPPPELGTYEIYGKRLELAIKENNTGRYHEPLIESVWKMFTHAHAACYKFFEEGYSDHHHYTSIIVPTFTNEINDIWNNVTAISADTYAGLLGDAIALTDGVTYCAEFAKLETEYPWELARPPKDLSNLRVKRSTDSASGEFECLTNSFDNTCPD